MELITENSDNLKGSFIPHHCVIKNESSSTKLRVVFDASMKTTSGISLNDILFTGQKLQNNIVEILLRFRLYSVVFTADIHKMFRQILVRPEDQVYQNILWRENSNEPLEIYKLKTVTYGLVSSPFLALRVLRQLINDEGHKYPLAKGVLEGNIYVDDILTGATTLEEACQLQEELIKLLSLGGFELRKWSASHRELLKNFHDSYHESPISFDDDHSHIIKILGLQWTASSDSFSYKTLPIQVVHNKRSILSHISQLYDPMGWLSPVIIKVKILLQRLWALGIGWDDIVPLTIQDQWLKFSMDLSSLSLVRIPHFVSTEGCSTSYLVGFSDASLNAYSAVVYVVVFNDNTTPCSYLMLGKSKVAPLKTLSVPRLELCGALSNLLKFVKSAVSQTIDISDTFAFTDSKTSPHLLKTFVANRVTEVIEIISPQCWHHVASSDNPADCSSRGLLPSQLKDHPLWWTGPSWMTFPVCDWPLAHATCLDVNTLPDVKPIVEVSLAVEETPPSLEQLLLSVSSFSKLLRITAWCRRFCNNIQSKGQRNLRPLSADELHSSLHFWISFTQRCFFEKEIEAVKRNKPTSNSIRKLSPFLDKTGLLRVGGRLRNAQIPQDTKHPVLLPKNSHLTKLLIDYYHISYLHAGPRTLQSLIQRKYWIVSIRNAVRSRLAKCLSCFKTKTTTHQPCMGDLPPARVNQGRPFLNVGIDFGGPFSVKESRRRNSKVTKAYLCLFVCMSTKAVHLEVVSDLSTDAFLAAFDRFVARRGLCNNVFTDCGTNFVGAKRYLTGIFKFYAEKENDEKISNYMSNKNISWNLNPPLAPHFGGLWEAGIRSAKHHLRRVLGDQALTFEELTTLCAKIEAILNSRPLCTLSPDPSEFDTLSPGHFIIGAPLVAIPERDMQDTPKNRLTRWIMLKKFSQHFWNRWKDEYLLSLQQRNKWLANTPNIKVDDVVLLKESKTLPLQWILGRIKKVYPGEDGIVRVVDVQTSTGTYQRPVVRLSPLPN